MSRARFAILMLTYNRLEAVQRCIESLRSTLDNGDVELWILDNASTDGTTGYVRDLEGGAIKVICCKLNYGVAGGRSILLEELARVGLPQRIVFLDSDTVIVDQGWLDDLDRALDAESVGIVGPGGSFVIDRWQGFAAGRPGEVDCVAGYCTMIKADLFKYGLQMDTSFGRFWCEDSDLNFQARALGFDVLCVPCGVEHYPAHSGYGQEPGLHDANFEKLRQKWQGKQIVKCEGGY